MYDIIFFFSPQSIFSSPAVAALCYYATWVVVIVITQCTVEPHVTEDVISLNVLCEINGPGVEVRSLLCCCFVVMPQL